MSTDMLVAAWRQLLIDPDLCWVLFEHGTCVVLPEPEGDLAHQATELLSSYGPVHPGSPSADFRSTTLRDAPGWVVGGHHPDILNYVAPAEVPRPEGPAVGLCGRNKRHRDGTELRIVHIEDKRVPHDSL